jgi:hypothetical protein
MESRLSACFGICFALLLGSSSPTLAASIFVQNPVANEFWLSDIDGAVTEADDFSVGANDVVRSVSWEGVYCCGNTPQASDAFTISFYSDAGAPGTLLQTFSVGAAVDRAPSGTLSNFGKYSYSADLGAGFAATGGVTYWISVVNDTTLDGNDRWYWAVSRPSTGAFAFQMGSQPWQLASGAFVFSLDNANLAASAVPEPTSMALLGVGLAGLGARKWRRRR